jgi:hypothetical protein
MSNRPSLQEILELLKLSPLYHQLSPPRRQESLEYLTLILGSSSDKEILINQGPEPPSDKDPAASETLRLM